MAQRSASLRAANLNLIPVLRALLRESSVTRAAANLNLSPSATSCALAELRLLMHDPLLVRVGRVMRLTPKAEQMVAKLEHACLALEAVLQEEAFDPATAVRAFVVAAPEYVALLLGPPLMAKIRMAAPGVQVRFVDVPGDLERCLALGTVDIGLVAVNHLSWAGVSAAPPCRDQMIGVVDANHELAALDQPGEADLDRYPALSWEPGLDLSARAAAANYPSPPRRGSSQLMVHGHTAMAMMVLDTDTVATMPAALARRLATDLPLHLFELPYEPLVLETGALWATVQDAEPAHRWFRQLVIDSLAEAHGG